MIRNKECGYPENHQTWTRRPRCVLRCHICNAKFVIASTMTITVGRRWLKPQGSVYVGEARLSALCSHSISLSLSTLARFIFTGPEIISDSVSPASLDAHFRLPAVSLSLSFTHFFSLSLVSFHLPSFHTLRIPTTFDYRSAALQGAHVWDPRPASADIIWTDRLNSTAKWSESSRNYEGRWNGMLWMQRDLF